MYRLYERQGEPPPPLLMTSAASTAMSRPADPMPDYPGVGGDPLLYAGAGGGMSAAAAAVAATPLGLDAMSVSGLGAGYASTNASCSDISGLCEIEDSEVNLSDYDSDQNGGGGLHGSTLGLSSQV